MTPKQAESGTQKRTKKRLLLGSNNDGCNNILLRNDVLMRFTIQQTDKMSGCILSCHSV